MYARFGNATAIETRRRDDDTLEQNDIDGKQVTTFEFPEGTSLSEALRAVKNAWGHHSKDGAPPAWVESDSEGLTSLLSEEFGCKTTVPKKWGESNQD